jgi:flagellin-like protein
MKQLDTIDRPIAGDRGVSPVIGVVLMVAVTVVLGAVVGTFVIEHGQDVGATGPRASLLVGADHVTNNLTIAHAGGDGLADARTRIVLTNETDGARTTFEPGNTAEVFAAGQRVLINTTAPGGGAATIGTRSDVFSGRVAANGGYVDGGLKRGMRYTVQVVDTESRRVVYETTVTA